MKKIDSKDFIVTMEIEGKQLSSVDFAQKIKEISNDGVNEIVFVIGGANGLDKSVKERADFKLSFSKMTFPHQLARVMLAEQIYRAFKIINNENYHK